MPQFSAGGDDNEFVDEWPHLGHVITTVHNDKADIISKRKFYVVRSITYCASLVNVTQLLNCHSLKHIAAVFMAV